MIGTYLTSDIVLTHFAHDTILSGLSKFSFITGALAVTSFHLRNKYSELYSMPYLSINELKSLEDIIRSRLKWISYYLSLGIFLTVALFISNLLIEFPKLSPYWIKSITPLLVAHITYSFYMIFDLNEAEHFKVLLLRRDRESEEKLRLINKLMESDDSQK